MASLITLLISLVLLSLIGLTRWRGHQALAHDTRVMLTQASQELLRSLESRRGTLTFIRDTLNREPSLTVPQLRAVGKSALAHTRHLIAAGWIQRGTDQPLWWAASPRLSSLELQQLNRAIRQRSRRSGFWRVPSTFVVTPTSQRMFLVMVEPLRSAAAGTRAVTGLFELKPLLEDFVSTHLSPAHPVQLLDGTTLLYRSANWNAAEGHGAIAERTIALDAARWSFHVQPQRTSLVNTLSWLNMLLIGLGVIAGLGVTIVVWLLAARTWILQRAVVRRTAALRRTLGRVRHLAVTDELTGLYNRRFFLDRWAWEYLRAKRYQRPLACLMIDVNGFKHVNDLLGHHAGDVLLQRIAQELQTVIRESDILARFGGDEFIVALPETSPAQAESVAEKLRNIRVPVPDGQRRGIASVGLCVGISQAEPREADAQKILETADQSLYEWKRRSDIL